jgi:hypothetical protein
MPTGYITATVDGNPAIAIAEEIRIRVIGLAGGKYDGFNDSHKKLDAGPMRAHDFRRGKARRKRTSSFLTPWWDIMAE